MTSSEPPAPFAPSALRSRETLTSRAWRAAAGGSFGPQLLDQAIARHDAIGAQQQNREQRALLRAAEREPLAVRADLKRAEDAEVHASPGRSRATLSRCRPLRHRRAARRALRESCEQAARQSGPKWAHPNLYAAKCYWPGVTERQVQQAAACAAAEATSGTASAIDYLGAILFPDDELVLCLFDAPRAPPYEGQPNGPASPASASWTHAGWPHPPRAIKASAGGQQPANLVRAHR